MFTYIKPEFMIHAFKQQRDSILKNRSICVARLGEFAVSMDMIDEDSFSLSLENVKTGSQYAGKIINIKAMDEEEIIPMVNDLLRMMQTINDKEIFDNREQIWKWYAMNWLENQDISLNDYIESRMMHNAQDEGFHWKSFEEYMAKDYLNMAATMAVIDRFAGSLEEKEKYKAFAAKDIVELRQKRSYEVVQETFAAKNEGLTTPKTYGFGIEVVAESRVEAREKLQSLLKNVDQGIFFIRG